LKATAVHQFIPSLAARDAIGAHCLQVRDVLIEMGLRSTIYADHAVAELAGSWEPYDGYRSRGAGEWILYQLSIGSRVGDYVRLRPEPKILNYHNITPASLFERWEPAQADEAGQGRRQLSKLAAVTAHAITPSRYNESELKDVGFRSTSVAPLLMDMSGFEGEAEPSTAAWLDRMRAAGGASILFVGRTAPNKAQHDLVKALWAYRRLYDPCARLHLVGGASSASYDKAVRRTVGALGLRDAVDFAGSVNDAERTAYYRGSDVFVCLSDHEGFCVPLVEAMAVGLPVIAYASSAVSETVGSGGLLLESKDPATVAAAIWRVVSDEALRRSLVAAGRRRVQDFAIGPARAAFASAVRQALETLA
jgi:glycosyltransferase involved in cell wall biosynthesis